MSLVFMTVRAQEETKLKNSNFSASLELTSKYMWRGIEYGDAPVVFPSLNYSYKGFSAFAMGGYATNGSHQEVDVGVSYTYDWISAGVSDYFYPSAVGEGLPFPPMWLVRTRTWKESRHTPHTPN